MPLRRSPADLRLGCLCLLLGSASALAQDTWVQKPLPVELQGAVAYDSDRHRAIQLTRGEYGEPRQTWEWDGDTWSLRPSSQIPSPRFGHGMCYDAARQRVVLFGGELAPISSGPLVNETWEWDGIDWIQRQPANSPSPRRHQAMVYDPSRQRVLLFGGTDGSVALSDTWEWDGTTWTERSPIVSPPGRSLPGMCFNGANGRVLMFGASGQRDTWEWDGTNWTQLFPAYRPQARSAPNMAYDAARGQVVLFGGTNSVRMFAYDDTWVWDGSTWLHLSPANRPTSQREGMYYDPVRERVAMLVPDREWTWDGVTWTARGFSPQHPQAGRIAYDEGRERIVYLAGTNTWEWDGARWHLRSPEQKPPLGSRSSAKMIYDPTRGRILYFHVTSQARTTWQWDGTHWTQLSSAQEPSARSHFAMAPDAARGQVVLFGGQLYARGLPFMGPMNADTWLWDGGSWTRASPAVSPTPRFGHAMAYDPRRQRVVLFSGSDGTQTMYDTWEWDGTTWLQRTPLTTPSAAASGLVYDPARQRIVLFGLGTTSGVMETWEWDGNDWARRLTLAQPPVSHFGSLAHDAARQRTLLVGARTTSVHGPTMPASSQPRGAGCAGGTGVPQWVAFGVPSIGNRSFALDLLKTAPNAPAAGLLSLAPATLPLSSGCNLLIDPARLVYAPQLQTNGAGFASLRIPIPLSGNLTGARLHVQGVVIDPPGFSGLAMTRALDLVVGDGLDFGPWM